MESAATLLKIDERSPVTVAAMHWPRQSTHRDLRYVLHRASPKHSGESATIPDEKQEPFAKYFRKSTITDAVLSLAHCRAQFSRATNSPILVTMRLFVGIPLPSSLSDELSRISLRYQSLKDNLRWYPPDSWHITLQFLGSVTPEQHACILSALQSISHPSVPVSTDALGFFDRAGVFFAQVALSPELVSLQQHVTAANLPCGFTPETRPYHPHITLARTKGRSGARSMRALQSQLQALPYRLFANFTASEFVLYESIPTPSGSRYEIHNHFPLV